jgi:glycosyltransferase involved in cell wall biosynthesis
VGRSIGQSVLEDVRGARSRALSRLALKGELVKIAHLTTVDASLLILLGTELQQHVEAGHEVIGISAPGPFVEELRSRKIRHVSVPALSRQFAIRKDLRALTELVARLRELRPDVLHTHNPKTGVMGRVIGHLLGIPAVVNTCHGLWVTPSDSPLKRTLVLGIEAAAAQFSDFELYQNPVDRQTLRWAVPSSKALVVGNGIDLGRFRFDPEGRLRVRDELGISPERLLVGAVGRRVEEKGILDFASAARVLGQRADFVWFGPIDSAKSDSVPHALPGIRVVDFRHDMPAVYSALDVFVLPSHREGFPRSAMEAASCERALVLSDISGCREIGADGVEALFTPLRSPEQLASTIGRLIEDELLRERLGQAARERALRCFDQCRVAHTSLAIYQRVLRLKGLSPT